MTEVSVTRKGQITIPVDIRRKFNIKEGMKVEVVEEEGKIVIRRVASIFDLAGSGSGKGQVSDVKSALDDMRDEDAPEKRL
jgi:AbrB family looped-hinge helix DNA binding protein